MISDHIKNVFIFALQSYLKQRIRSNVDKPMLALMTESAGAALMTLLISWALKGMPRPPQLMADKSQQIVDSFLKDFMI
jgi:hypothetical protein